MRGHTRSGSVALVIAVLVLAVVVGAAIPLLSGEPRVFYNAPAWTPPPSRTISVVSSHRMATATGTSTALVSIQLTLVPKQAVIPLPAMTPSATPTLTAVPAIASGATATITLGSTPTSIIKNTIPSVTSTPALAVSTAEIQPLAAGETAEVAGLRSPTPTKTGETPTPTPTVQRRPTATFSVPIAVSPPALANPGDGASGKGVIRFEWLPTGPLPTGAAYELVWWNPSEPPEAARGLAPPTQASSQELNIDALFLSNQVPGGRLFWTVLIVRLQPYTRLTQPAQSPQHRFVYEEEGPPPAPAVPPPPRP